MMKKLTTMKKGELKKWVVFFAVMFWGLVSVLVLGGDENPQEQLGFFEYLAIKFVALVSFITCYKVAEYCHRKGLFPEVEDE